MALADYFQRNATAITQILSTLNGSILEEKLLEARVGIGVAEEANSPEGRALLDLAVRILARLYPTLSIRNGIGANALAADLTALARAINPRIEIIEGEAEVQVAVGQNAPNFAPLVFYAGSDGWDARISTTSPQTVGSSENPFGAGAAACFASANVFRKVMLDSADDIIDKELAFSVLDLESSLTRDNIEIRPETFCEDIALIGLGAIGNATVWALSKVPLAGKIHLVDPEPIELSNLQRYVLAERKDELRSKVDTAGDLFNGSLSAVRHSVSWADFVQGQGYFWRRVLVGVDSARDRRAVQASLPGWIANAWTQPGDLGLSIHAFEGEGACLNCLYLPKQLLEHEDSIIANALGVPERLKQIRQLLYYGHGAPQDLLEAIATKLSVPIDKLLAFEGQPLRTLYVEGVCGGAIIPLGQSGTPRQDAHVPLAHQSALAGVLLGGAFVADLLRGPHPTTMVTRIDLMRPLGRFLSQPARKDERGICICQDPDYITAFKHKYSSLPVVA
jgi:hypothetical protein